MAPKFSDIAKAPKDILNEDYASKNSFKVKKNAGPVSITVDTARSDSGALSSKIGGKASYAGMSFDKIQHEADGSPTLETSILPMPGMKVSFKGGKGADLGADYKFGSGVSTLKLDAKELSKVSASTSFGVANGIVVGGDATYNLKGKTGLGSVNVGASYGSGKFFAAVTAAGSSSVNLSASYQVSPDSSIASITTHSASAPITVGAVGGSYKAPFGLVKAKISGSGVVSASLVKEIAPKVMLTTSGSMTKTDTSTFKYGVGLTM